MRLDAYLSGGANMKKLDAKELIEMGKVTVQGNVVLAPHYQVISPPFSS